MARKNREWEACAAGALASSYGQSLVGRSVRTVKVGSWPGGVATVSRINPDAKDDNIAFFVTAPFWPPKDEPDLGPDMGVYRDKPVTLYPQRRKRLTITRTEMRELMLAQAAIPHMPVDALIDDFIARKRRPT